MAVRVKAAQSACPNVLAVFWTDSEPLPSSSKTGSSPSIAKVSRHDLEIGAVCGNSARTDLCGGNYCLYRYHTSCNTYSALILQ